MKKFVELTKDEEEHAIELYTNSLVLNCLDASTFDDEYIRIVHNAGLTATAMGIGFGIDAIAAHYKLIKDSKKVAIKINEGYLCNYTLSRLINFKIKEDEEVGLVLAKVFVDAGINIPKDLFVKVFEKITQHI